jgi:hypothetical protein
MGTRLQTRIERIEEINAPLLKLVAARRRLYDHFSKGPHPDIDYVMAIADYVGCPLDSETAARDRLTWGVLSSLEIEVRFPHVPKTLEIVETAMRFALIRMTREFYGREITVEEVKKEVELSQQAEADYHAGVPADESEAAQYFRSLFAQYPRLKFESASMAAYMSGADARTL